MKVEFKKFKFIRDKFSRLIFEASSFFRKTHGIIIPPGVVDVVVGNLHRGSRLRRGVRNLGWLLKPARSVNGLARDISLSLQESRGLIRGKDIVKRAASLISHQVSPKKLATGIDAGRFIGPKLMYQMRAASHLSKRYMLSIINRNSEKMIKHIWRNSINHWRY